MSSGKKYLIQTILLFFSWGYFKTHSSILFIQQVTTDRIFPQLTLCKKADGGWGESQLTGCLFCLGSRAQNCDHLAWWSTCNPTTALLAPVDLFLFEAVFIMCIHVGVCTRSTVPSEAAVAGQLGTGHTGRCALTAWVLGPRLRSSAFLLQSQLLGHVLSPKFFFFLRLCLIITQTGLNLAM